jgi:hypothetical protein
MVAVEVKDYTVVLIPMLLTVWILYYIKAQILYLSRLEEVEDLMYFFRAIMRLLAADLEAELILHIQVKLVEQ